MSRATVAVSTDEANADEERPMSACGFGARVAVLVWFAGSVFVIAATAVVVIASSFTGTEALAERLVWGLYGGLLWGVYVAVIAQPIVLAVAVLAFVCSALWRYLRPSADSSAIAIVSWGVLAVLVAGTGPSLVDLVLVVGIAVVVPLAVGGPLWWWSGAAAAALIALALAPGWPTGLFALPLLGAALVSLGSAVRSAGPLYFWTVEDLARSLAAAYVVVAAGALLASASGWSLLGVHEPIVELTAVHYLYAGCAALVLATHAYIPAGQPWHRLSGSGLAVTAVAPVVVALGFVSGWAVAQVGGAVLMTVGVWITATLQLLSLRRTRPLGAAALLAVSGLAVWVPMVLAVAWAAGQHWDVPALSIPDMVRTHGLGNAFAFVLCGLVGRNLSVGRRVLDGEEPW